MTIQKANLNYQQLMLGEGFELVDEGEGALTEQQRYEREAAARQALELLFAGDVEGWRDGDYSKGVPPRDELGNWITPAWMNDLLYLLDHGWPWRQAVYMAWDASPKAGRWPRSQEALATEVLGLTSDRVISEWRRKNPAIETMISTMQSAKLMQNRGDVFAALINSAKNADYKHHPDRKLFLQMTGDYVPVSQIRALVASGQLRLKNDVTEMSDEELLAYVSSGDFENTEEGEDAAE